VLEWRSVGTGTRGAASRMKKNGRPDAMTTLSFEGAGGCAEILVERAVVLRIAGVALFAGGR